MEGTTKDNNHGALLSWTTILESWLVVKLNILHIRNTHNHMIVLLKYYGYKYNACLHCALAPPATSYFF